ncbi:hypothetical protein PCANC_23838 [Puccinia coronata f. sp. avenae]|uniref:COP9 signalosome complex subunit 3 n=1 Tax=Puccinia coronata f. sp. avenae TaxID=200324 RepID=A0A2N5S147_9BASI|nr:hypothetical protein PCASD_24521 [Puccinia coronata f. sp. avenae]PLW30433.1 hypothetical protein PCASD_15604 [Puccinia coronata f. sp. avenae]PLW33152.1 hypothetical protein PCANC_23838 [Puccinia coronata f. sp. avenae]
MENQLQLQPQPQPQPQPNEQPAGPTPTRRDFSPDQQHAFLSWIISNRAAHPQSVFQRLRDTPPELLSCLPLPGTADEDPLDQLIQPDTDPIPYFHILICRFETCFNRIDTQKTLLHAHKFCAAVEPKLLHLISPTNSELFLLVKHLVQWSSQAGLLQTVIEPLLQLIRSYGPINILTPLHHELLKISLKTRSIDLALELTNMDIDIDQKRYPIRYQDHLIYHYLAGTVQALGKNYQRAIHLLTIAVSAPGSAISQLQIDAYKKLILVSLLSKSCPPVLPPYTNPHLKSAFKSSSHTKVYLEFMHLYEHAERGSEAYAQLITMAENNLAQFQKDNNSGLIKLCIEVLPQKAIKRLIPIYVSIPIAKIDLMLGHLTEGNASGLVTSMIESGELKAHIDRGNKMLVFDDSGSGGGEGQTLEDTEHSSHTSLQRIVEQVQLTAQRMQEKSAEMEQDKELLRRIIIDLRAAAAEKQQHSSANEMFNSAHGLPPTDRAFAGIIEEELVDVGMAWDD